VARLAEAAAIYLAHLNPLTKAHQRIISSLISNYKVYVFPVRFLKNNCEINTKSFPFPYALRKEMIESVFGLDKNEITILPFYSFTSPFIKYLPPLLSPYSWILRNQIIGNVIEEKVISYTGNIAERVMLAIYRLRPLRASRIQVSASEVRTMLYNEALSEKIKQDNRIEKSRSWRSKVPETAIQIIEDNWRIVERFANCRDSTIKVMGMKFPKEGFI
jgi:hypothetical protein